MCPKNESKMNVCILSVAFDRRPHAHLSVDQFNDIRDEMYRVQGNQIITEQNRQCLFLFSHMFR